MRNFICFFRFELKRFLRLRNIIIFILILLLSLYLINSGIDSSKTTKTKVEEFKKVEAVIFSKIMNYVHYSFLGFRVLYVPGDAAIFFKGTGVSQGLTAAVDSVTKLDIKNDYKSGAVFAGNNYIPPGFAGLLLLLISLPVLFYGYETFRDKEYLKFLCSFVSYKKAFFQLVLARFMLPALSFVLIFGIMFSWLLLRDVTLSAQVVHILFIYLAVTILMTLFFFLCGAAAGGIRSGAAAKTAIVSLWLTALLIIPGILNKIINSRAEDIISSYKIELDKLNLMKEYEERAEKEFGSKFHRNNMELARKIIEDYWQKDYKKMEAAEESLKTEISEVISYYRTLSIFFPTTFYHAFCGEAGSMGFDSFIDFYTYLQESKRKFVRFWIDRVYYNDPKVLVNFVKDNENLYFAHCRLPGNFSSGMLVLLFYIAAAAALSFWCFKRTLFYIAAAAKSQPRGEDIKLETGRFKTWITRRESFKNLLYSLLSGQHKRYRKKGHNRKIFIDDLDISAEKFPGKPVYLCHARRLPAHVKAADIISFVCGINGKNKQEKAGFYKDPEIAAAKNEKFAAVKKSVQGKILVKLLELKKSNIYIANDVTAGMPIDFFIGFKEKMEALKEEGALALHFVSTEVVVDESEYEETEYHDSTTWARLVGEHKNLRSRQKT